MSIKGRLKILLLCLASTGYAFAADAAHDMIIAAREKAANGDFKTAAVLYQKAISMDEKNMVARKELASLLIDAKKNDLDAELNDIEEAVLEVTKKVE